MVAAAGRAVPRRRPELALRAGPPGPILRGMPTVLRVGPYRFFFYASDRPEPAHIHVERDENRAKFWLGPVRLQDSGGFRGPELARVAALVAEHEATLRSAWDEYFRD